MCDFMNEKLLENAWNTNVDGECLENRLEIQIHVNYLD